MIASFALGLLAVFGFASSSLAAEPAPAPSSLARAFRPVRPPSGRLFRFRLPFEPATLDWTHGDTPVLVTLNTMRGLYRVNEQGEVTADLVKDAETLSDGKLWRFTLKEGVTWSDGVPLNAGHATEGLRRLMDPLTASGYSYFLGDVEGSKETDPKKFGIKIVSERVFEVRLSRPVPYLPAILSHWVTFPVRPDLIARYKDYGSNPKHMAYLGAFQVSDWQKGMRLILTPNPKAETAPWFQRVEAWIIADDLTALNLFDTGHLEFMTDPGNLTFKHANLKSYPSPILYFVGLGVGHPLLQTPHGAQALTLALNRVELPQALGAEHRVTNDLCPPEIWKNIGGPPTSAEESTAALKSDPSAALAALKKAGFEAGSKVPPLTLHYFDRPMIRELAQWIQAQWKKNLGLNVTLNGADPKVYWTQLSKKPADLFVNSKGASYPDPDTFFRLFTSTSPQNLGRWQDPEYDAWAGAGSMSTSDRERRKQYGLAAKRALQDRPALIPLYFRATQMLVKPYVTGLVISPLTGVDFGAAQYP